MGQRYHETLTCRLERLGSLRLSKYSASEVSCALAIGHWHAWKSTITCSHTPASALTYVANTMHDQRCG